MCFVSAHCGGVHEIRNILFLFTADALALILSDRYHFISMVRLYQSVHPLLSVSYDIISSKTTCDAILFVVPLEGLSKPLYPISYRDIVYKITLSHM